MQGGLLQAGLVQCRTPCKGNCSADRVASACKVHCAGMQSTLRWQATQTALDQQAHAQHWNVQHCIGKQSTLHWRAAQAALDHKHMCNLFRATATCTMITTHTTQSLNHTIDGSNIMASKNPGSGVRALATKAASSTHLHDATVGLMTKQVGICGVPWHWRW